MIVGERFERERILVSGERFERCRFVDCELVFDGRVVHLAGNSFERCTWHFDGPAAATLELVAALSRDDAGFRAAMARRLGLERGAAPREAASPRPQGRTAAGAGRRR